MVRGPPWHALASVIVVIVVVVVVAGVVVDVGVAVGQHSLLICAGRSVFVMVALSMLCIHFGSLASYLL